MVIRLSIMIRFSNWLWIFNFRLVFNKIITLQNVYLYIIYALFIHFSHFDGISKLQTKHDGNTTETRA